MQIRPEIFELHDEITGYRRLLHQHPGTAYEETFLSNFVQEKLTEWDIPYEANIAETGIVATIVGNKNTTNHAIGIRADMDALNLTEEGEKDWVSKVPGKMHGCGHDGHSSMLLGTIKYLKDNRNFDGIVHFIFQPAEEGRRGAITMINEGLFERFPCDEVYAMHNWPSLPRGTFATRPGPIMAASDHFSIHIEGSGGHAALPHRCVDPVVVGSTIVSALQTLVSRKCPPVEPAVISITNFHSGSGMHNVIPNRAELSGTVRTYNETLRHELKEAIGDLSKRIAGAMGASVTYDYDMVIDPTINDIEAMELCAEAAHKVFPDEDIDLDIVPSMGGEDFGTMILARKGCYVLLGQGEPNQSNSPFNCPLHSPFYDFNDGIIPIGMEYWATLVETALPLK